MGVQIEEKHGFLHCKAPKGILGDYIALSFPSVGATENILLAAATARGTTVIQNAAREPEIADLAVYLNRCGAKIYGAGESSIVIDGVNALEGTEHTVMPDRIAAATYMAAAAVTGGELLLQNVPDASLCSMQSVFEETGCRLIREADSLYLSAPRRLNAVGHIRTMPYPGFPTDAQAPIMAMAVLGSGTSVFVENIFESRYKHAGELIRLGARISIEGKVAVVQGVSQLFGASVEARELRGGASLVVAGLAAQGRTSVSGVEYIDRGYEDIVGNLKLLGARIERD
ncbi:MAG: UDP-N-acetylglucosamine 1-carboxyvinyltransferase, partial [Oscillospiraceae bacterium]